MKPELFKRLTPRQAECLRLVARDRAAKEIGRILGISDETVEAHIKAALRKLGTNSRFVAARALAEHEGRTHPVVMPTQEEAPPDPTPASEGPSYQLGAIERGAQIVRDAAAETLGSPVPPAFRSPSRGALRHDMSPVHRIALAAVIAAAIVIVAAAARPLAEGFQALANLMQPRH